MWAFKHPEVFSSKDVVKVGNEVPLIPLSVDPPDHAKYRRLLDPQFSPKKMAELEPEMRKLVERGHRRVHRPRASATSTRTSRRRCPSTFFIALMGLPQSDLPRFLQVARRHDPARRRHDRGSDQADPRGAPATRSPTYFEPRARRAARRPDDGRLLSMLVHAEVEGRPLTHAELLGTCHLLMLGGLDTVTATLDCMITYLAPHPERRQAIVDDPELIPRRGRGAAAPPDAR